MNKTLKITAIVGIVFMTFSVSYYFLLLLPAQNATTALENNRTQCSIQAQKALENIEATYGSSSGNLLYEQDNHFNPFMNKCFVLITFIGNGVNNILIDADEMTFIASGNWSGYDTSNGNYSIGPDMDTSSTYQQVTDFENEAMGKITATTQKFPYSDYR